jgi:hypothetical protein
METREENTMQTTTHDPWPHLTDDLLLEPALLTEYLRMHGVDVDRPTIAALLLVDRRCLWQIVTDVARAEAQVHASILRWAQTMAQDARGGAA